MELSKKGEREDGERLQVIGKTEEVLSISLGRAQRNGGDNAGEEIKKTKFHAYHASRRACRQTGQAGRQAGQIAMTKQITNSHDQNTKLR